MFLKKILFLVILRSSTSVNNLSDFYLFLDIMPVSLKEEADSFLSIWKDDVIRKEKLAVIKVDKKFKMQNE